MRSAIDAFVDRGYRRAVAFSVGGTQECAYARNADDPMPCASLAKLVVAIAATRAAEVAQKPVPINDLPRSRYPSVLSAFDWGRELSLGEIIRLSLITSDNSCATYLFDLVGQTAVDDAIDWLGLEATSITVGFGDAFLGDAGRANVMSANDAHKTIAAIVSSDDLADLSDALRNNVRNSRIPGALRDETVVRHKTGSLEGVVNDAGVVEGHRLKFHFSFLCDDESSVAAAERDIRGCVQAIVSEFDEGLIA